MDALEFAKTGKEELHARLAQKGKLTEDEVVKKFFADQGHVFENIDIPKILVLVKSPKING